MNEQKVKVMNGLIGGETFHLNVPVDLMRTVLEEWLHHAYRCDIYTRPSKKDGYKVIETKDELFTAHVLEWLGDDIEVYVERRNEA